MSPLQSWKEKVAETLTVAAGVPIEAADLVIPEVAHGDLALPCFRLAKILRTSPVELAKKIADALESEPIPLIEDATAAGPYVNISLFRATAAHHVMEAVSQPGYGQMAGDGKKILLEYVSPNTNKPLHLGHLRNATLGWSIAATLEANGNTVIKTEIVNDRGIHIMKPLLAYQRWGNHETPETSGMKSDHLVAKYYVLYGEKVKEDSSLDTEAQELLRKWEAGDAEVRSQWQTLRQWALDGQRTTYERIGISFDHHDFESEIYEAGKNIAEDAVTRGIARRRDDGAVVVDVGEMSDKEKVLLRADGTSVYITQDLALAQKRMTDIHPDRMVYVIGQEQDYQFEILFTILEKLEIASREQLVHVSYHHVLLPEGRMKSREGTVVDTDELLDELHDLAAQEVKKRTPDINEVNLEHRAERIALAAAKFYLLKVHPKSDITFSPKESIAFVGNTGPYILYTYARSQSIFRKSDAFKNELQSLPKTITPSEWRMLTLLARFPDTVNNAAHTYDPAVIAEFAYDLAKAINDFYEKDSVLKAEDEVRAWRLALLQHTTKVLKEALRLLGIETLDEM